MRVTSKSLLKWNQVAIHVWGESACFSIPYTASGGNSMSYPLITGSAARGILGAIYAHPHDLRDKNGNPAYTKNFDWVVDKIFILNPIRFYSYGINARKAAGGGIIIPQYITALLDVSYVIVGHPHIITKRVDNDIEKYKSIFNRRCASGKAYTQPHFGYAKYPARYAPVPTIFETEDINTSIYGYLLGMKYDDSAGISSKPPEAIFLPELKIINGVADLEKYNNEGAK